jgi:hypothetical protein
MIRWPAVLVLGAALVGGCSAAPTPPAGAGATLSADGALRLRHQIMVRYGERAEVFEGYMIWRGDAFFVRAFAGPGVDLFTVVRDGATQRSALHLSGLGDRIDLEAVGADIARAYLGGCPAPAGGGAARCTFHGEPLEERYAPDGRLLERRFPTAHGIGVTIRYAEHRRSAARELAGRITLEWGDGGNSMVIVLLDVEDAGDVDPAALPLGQ